MLKLITITLTAASAFLTTVVLNLVSQEEVSIGNAEFNPAEHLVLSLATPSVLADAATDGEKTYKKCQACHSLDAGRHQVGPSLWGVFGAKAGSADGYAYSATMENSGIVWDEESLDAFLVNPPQMLPGAWMLFPGLRREEDRKAIIAYLKQESDANGQSRETIAAAPAGSGSDLDNPRAAGRPPRSREAIIRQRFPEGNPQD